MVEAVNSWDVGTYGIGGTLAGAVGKDIKIIAAGCRDIGSLRFYAQKDDPIVQDVYKRQPLPL